MQIDSSENLEPPVLSNQQANEAFTKGTFSLMDGTADGGLHVTFFSRPKFFCGDDPEHRKPGPAVPHIRIYHPGTKDTIERPVTAQDKQRFSLQYAAWESGKNFGTPLDTWPGVPAGLADEFRILNVYTVEQLAQASDQVIQKLGSAALHLRAKAQEEMFSKKTEPVINELRKENEDLRGEVALLSEQVQALIKAADENPKGGKGGKGS